MSACGHLTESATSGVATALRAVDCLANESAAGAFGRLFGSGGALMPALTIGLTLYIAFFAISMLTGRSRLGLSALTPRMITLGLVLTFATSWVAYRSVVWNLAVGGPDQIAAILMGAKGSAIDLFARRIDVIFAAISQAATEASGAAAASADQGASGQGAAGTFTPATLVWVAALMLLLGTVGVMLTARIALAVLLMVGPVFVVLALFKGTRGLFAGWARAIALTALVPLFAVLGGGFMLELAVPVVGELAGAGTVEARPAMALFVLAAAHLALMAMVLRISGTMVSGWSVFGLAIPGSGRRDEDRHAGMAVPLAVATAAPALHHRQATASRIVVPPQPLAADLPPPGARPAMASRIVNERIVSPRSTSPALRGRAHGVGSRFARPIRSSREMIR